jgi:hypothetical protein
MGVRVSDREMFDRVIELLPPGWKPARYAATDHLFSLKVGGQESRIRRFNILYQNGDLLFRTLNLEDMLDYLETKLHNFVAVYAQRRVFIHSGVVGWRGKAVLIPGESLSGKTTLVTELVRAGATYYSDEFAVLDSHGRVHPFPRTLGLREEGETVQKKLKVEEMGGVAGARPLPVKMIVFSQYRQGARWLPRKLSEGQAVLALMKNSRSVRLQPEFAMSAMRQAVSNSTAVRSARGNTRETVDFILRELGG